MERRIRKQPAGHVVEVPRIRHTKSDAIVDGQPINIKITDNPAYIQEHLKRKPQAGWCFTIRGQTYC